MIRHSFLHFPVDAALAETSLALMHATSHDFPAWLAVLIPFLILLALWDAAWKAIGMWKSARNNQVAWFVCIAIFNTVGILPIIYLLWCQRDRNTQATPP